MKSTEQLQLAIDTLTVFVRKFWLIAWIVLIFTSVAIIYVFIAEPSYTSTAVIFPNTRQSFDRFSSLSSLVGLMGAPTGDDGIYSTYYYPVLASSQSIITDILPHEISIKTKDGFFTGTIFEFLKKYENVQDTVGAVKFISDGVTSQNDFDSGIFRISFTSTSPFFAKEVTNALVRAIDRFNNMNRRNAAEKSLSHTVKRIEESKLDFERNQDLLIEFMSKHQTNNLSPQANAYAEQLRARKDISKDIYINLIKQREYNEIEISKNYPVLTVIDSAYVPTQKSFPKRKEIVIFVFAFSLVIGIMIVLLVNSVEKNISSVPQEKVQNLRKAIGDIFHVRIQR